MKKVLIFRHATAIGGAERYLFSLVRESSQNISYHVVTNFEAVASEVGRLGVTSSVVPYGWEPFSRRSVLSFYFNEYSDRRKLVAAMLEYFGQEKGVVYCHSLTDKLLVTPAAVKAGHKVVWLEHGPMIGRLLTWPPLIRRYRAVSNLASQIICVSHITAENIATSGVAKEKLRVIYNGTPPIEPAVKAPSHLTRLVTTNRLVPEKGYMELFEALAIIKNLPWQLAVVANGPAEAVIHGRAAELGLTGKIIFHGFQENVVDYLRQADVFVNPTVYPGEGLPIANIEALAAALPVVTSASGGARETIEDGISGLFIDPKDAVQTSEVLKKIILDPALRQKLGAAGQERWQQLFSLKKMVDETTKVLLS